MPPPVLPRRSTIKRVDSLRWAKALSSAFARSIPTAPGNMVTFSQPIPSGSCEQITDFGNNDRMLLGARRRHLKGACHPLSVWLLDGVLGIFSDGKDWRIRRAQVSISNLEKDVAGPQPCGVRRTALVNILEHPTLFAI